MAIVAVALLAGGALASPDVDSAIIKTRIFNDDPTSVITTTNLYPTTISIKDDSLDADGGGGYANRHNFRLSANGGISEAVFNNGDSFEFWADVTITGPANSEGGLNLSPWWSQDVDGVFMINAVSGEIACFGGRLPFYSFTSEYGLTYSKGDTVRLGMIYHARQLNESHPGRIQYVFTDANDVTYYSPIKLFDMGNPDEDPPYGLWGMLNDARVGGYFQPQINSADPNNYGEIVFENMYYTPEPTTLALFAVAGLAVLRRRR
jgi:hypothetical protein